MPKCVWLLVFLFFFLTNPGVSQDRFWVNSGVGNWSDASNWSCTSGGLGGDGAPGVGDKAIFDASGLGDALVDVDVVISEIDAQVGYAGSITQGPGFAIILSGNISVAGGNFQGGDSDITIGGDLTVEQSLKWLTSI